MLQMARFFKFCHYHKNGNFSKKNHLVNYLWSKCWDQGGASMNHKTFGNMVHPNTLTLISYVGKQL